MTRLFLVVTALLMGVTPAAQAACNGAYRCSQVTVERIYPRMYGYTLIETSGDETNLSCSATSNIYLRLDQPNPSSSSDAHEAIYALLLTAFVQGISVTVVLHQTTNNYCKIEGAYLDS